MTEAVRVEAADAILDADVTVPGTARGAVLFAHGSGSSRHSPRNRAVADRLQRNGFATILADLLSEQEESADQDTGALRFDIDLLARRLTAIADWCGSHPRLAPLPLGLFGASTGAAAALICAAQRPGRVAAVVSRGGRPDLAGPRLAEVSVPTLLIVGSRDETVLKLNTAAAAQLGGPAQLRVVEGATHLFEEPGALGQVADLAARWFAEHLPAAPAA